MDAYNRTLVEPQRIVRLVAQLGVVRRIDGRGGPSWDHLRWVLLLINVARLDCQRLDAVVADVVRGRYHRVGLGVRRRQVVHLQGGDLRQVPDDLLILLTVLDASCSFQWERQRLLSMYMMM